MFLQGLCSQPDPPTCLTKLKSSSQGLTTLQACMRMDLSSGFLNGQGSAVISYLQDPALKSIAGGDFLRPIIKLLVEPPIFWDELVNLFKNKTLSVDGERSFAWLLWELISMPNQDGEAYHPLAKDPSIQSRLIGSSDDVIRGIGHKIEHFLATLSSSTAYSSYGPGGRHDNDFADFRKISILPTELELKSTDDPFLRVASEIDDPKHAGNRVAVHLDNQYRLLREDMIGEMRDELQVARGKQKGQRKGLVAQGLQPVGVFCGTPDRREAWGLKLQMKKDLYGLTNTPQIPARKAYLDRNKNLFRHQNQACLLVDGQVVGFPTIFRDMDLLAAKPSVVVAQFSDKQSAANALLRMKLMKDWAELVQMNTAVFSYEPVLLRLQQKKELQLSEELLEWTPGDAVLCPSAYPVAIVESLRADPLQQLQDLLKTPKPVKLNTSQSASLMMGLSQRVSLIQGPPGISLFISSEGFANKIHRDREVVYRGTPCENTSRFHRKEDPHRMLHESCFGPVPWSVIAHVKVLLRDLD